MNFTFKLTRKINFPIDVVFAAISEERQVSKYLGNSIIELQKGGKVRLFDGWVEGVLMEFEPNKKLSYTWKPAEWDAKTAPSLVEYLFNDLGNSTEIILTHSVLPTEKEANSHKEGWEDFVFLPLEEYLEGM